jgi:hypothetical protein
MIRSYTAEAKSEKWTKVMGVRIHFPIEPYNSWAYIKPPFEIPAYERQADISDDGEVKPAEDSDGITTKSRFESQEEGEPAYGVIKNVGTIKAVQVRVYGLNFPHGLFATIIDSTGNAKEVFMGYLDNKGIDGWMNLTWENPGYILEVRNRELRKAPLYPTSTPFIKFGGFRVARDAAQPGGDFITYFKDVKVIYDKAVRDTGTPDIDNEGLWGIIEDRETARKVWEMERFGQNQVLRYLETEKRAKENSFTNEDDEDDQ